MLNLSELIKKVSKDKRIKDMGIRQYEVKVIIKVFIELLLKSLLTYGVVKIQGLFTLNIRKAKGRKIANPQSGKHMYSKDYYKVGIEPSKNLKEGLEKLRDGK
jgi:nucleoid DNA-binding protein